MNTYVCIECYLLNADWSEECSRHYIVVQYNKTCVMCNIHLSLDFRQCDLVYPTVMPCIQFWTHLVKWCRQVCWISHLCLSVGWDSDWLRAGDRIPVGGKIFCTRPDWPAQSPIQWVPGLSWG